MNGSWQKLLFSHVVMLFLLHYSIQSRCISIAMLGVFPGIRMKAAFRKLSEFNIGLGAAFDALLGVSSSWLHGSG